MRDEFLLLLWAVWKTREDMSWKRGMDITCLCFVLGLRDLEKTETLQGSWFC